MKKYHHYLCEQLLTLNKPVIPQSWRVLITGITSIHGWPIFQLFNNQLDPACLYGIRPPKMNSPDQSNVIGLCISDIDGLIKIKNEFDPTHIIYCSGVCDLDACEDKPEWARKINVGGPEAISAVFGKTSSIMFISTDLVFSGYHPPEDGYQEDDAKDPVSIVGRTFSEAEEVIKQCQQWSIIRLGLPTGDSITGDKGAVDFIEKRFKKKLKLTLFHDEYRSCLECDEVAIAIYWMLFYQVKGIYHLGGDKKESLFQLGQEVLKKGPYQKHLLDTKSFEEDFNGPPRIGDVSLNKTKAEQWLQKIMQE